MKKIIVFGIAIIALGACNNKIQSSSEVENGTTQVDSILQTDSICVSK